MTHVLKTLAFGKEDPKEGEVVLIGFMLNIEFLRSYGGGFPWP
jgi:hypothetical protein